MQSSLSSSLVFHLVGNPGVGAAVDGMVLEVEDNYCRDKALEEVEDNYCHGKALEEVDSYYHDMVMAGDSQIH